MLLRLSDEKCLKFWQLRKSSFWSAGTHNWAKFQHGVWWENLSCVKTERREAFWKARLPTSSHQLRWKAKAKNTTVMRTGTEMHFKPPRGHSLNNEVKEWWWNREQPGPSEGLVVTFPKPQKSQLRSASGGRNCAPRPSKVSALLRTQGSLSLTWAGWGASVWGGWCEGVRLLLRPSCSERWPAGGERECEYLWVNNRTQQAGKFKSQWK